MARRLYEEEYNDKPVVKPKSIKRRSASAYCEDDKEELLIRGYRAGRDFADVVFDIFNLINGR